MPRVTWLFERLLTLNINILQLIKIYCYERFFRGTKISIFVEIGIFYYRFNILVYVYATSKM